MPGFPILKKFLLGLIYFGRRVCSQACCCEGRENLVFGKPVVAKDESCFPPLTARSTFPETLHFCVAPGITLTRCRGCADASLPLTAVHPLQWSAKTRRFICLSTSSSLGEMESSLLNSFVAGNCLGCGVFFLENCLSLLPLALSLRFMCISGCRSLIAASSSPPLFTLSEAFSPLFSISLFFPPVVADDSWVERGGER